MNNTIIKPCPPDCPFDWVRFHKDLDIVLAHLIDETGALPSKTAIMELMQFSYRKQPKGTENA